MNSTTIRIVHRAEQDRAIAIQMMAFSADPVMRWLWPEPHAYLSHFPGLVRGFGGRALEHDSAFSTEDVLGGSFWLPPGVTPDEEALDALLRETVPEPRRSAILQVFEQMGAAHPAEPHWHLALIGVDPTSQGKGVGAALLRHTLEMIDEKGLHSYLESSNPRNIPLYQRHGFEVVGKICVGDSPPVVPMVRPRSPGR
jgi:ribosomal protein S18 acetylase RimI-like enzyme